MIKIRKIRTKSDTSLCLKTNQRPDSSSSKDNSLHKSIQAKRKQKLYLEYLIKEKNRIIGRSEIRKMHENLIIVKSKKISKAEKLQKRNEAATKIQKVVKGWLTRKKYECEFISISRSIANANLKDLNDNMPAVFLFGRNCLHAAGVIQKSYRKYITRLKIARLMRAYEITIQNNARTQAKRYLRRVFKVFFSKDKLCCAKEDHRIRNELFRIRKNLATLCIKSYLQRKNISIRDITLAYKIERLAKLGINLLESKPQTAQPVAKEKKKSRLLFRVHYNYYKPVLSQRNSRILEPTQASNSRSRLRLSPNTSVHTRHKSDFSLYFRPSRPATPYR